MNMLSNEKVNFKSLEENIYGSKWWGILKENERKIK